MELAFFFEAVEEGSKWAEVGTWVLGIAITAFAGTGVKALVDWIKTQKVIKKLHLEGIVDKVAARALHYAESLGSRLASHESTEKLNLAKDAFQAELAKQGIKLDAGSIDRRLEGLFNKLKPEIESYKKLKKEG